MKECTVAVRVYRLSCWRVFFIPWYECINTSECKFNRNVVPTFYSYTFNIAGERKRRGKQRNRAAKSSHATKLGDDEEEAPVIPRFILSPEDAAHFDSIDDDAIEKRRERKMKRKARRKAKKARKRASSKKKSKDGDVAKHVPLEPVNHPDAASDNEYAGMIDSGDEDEPKRGILESRVIEVRGDDDVGGAASGGDDDDEVGFQLRSSLACAPLLSYRAF